MFSADLARVALIRKLQPEWQRHKLNGIGGKIEASDSSEQVAMVREFREETGVVTTCAQWRRFLFMAGANDDATEFALDCFVTTGDLSALRTQEAETIEILPVSALHVGRPDTLDNVVWLVGLARDHLQDGRPRFADVCY